MRRPCPDVAASMLGLGPDSIASAANLNTLSDSRGCLAPNQLPLTRNLSLPPTSIHTNSPTNPHPPPTLNSLPTPTHPPISANPTCSPRMPDTPQLPPDTHFSSNPPFQQFRPPTALSHQGT